MRRLLIRVDANAEIGWGHLMRCLAIADAWRDAGGRASFAIRGSRTSVREVARIRSRGHACFEMPPLTSAAGDHRYLQCVANSTDPTWVLVDGYHFSPDYQAGVRRAGWNLAVIDDTGHLPRYHADLLINSSPVADRIDYVCDADTMLLLGPQYLSIRPEVLRHRTERGRTAEAAERILVTLGGGDATQVLATIIEGLAKLQGRQFEAQIAVGSSNRAELESLLAKLADPRLSLVDAADDLPRRMVWADMAVSAAGTTLWELAALGVPSISLTLADNQEPIARELAERGATRQLGPAGQATASEIADAIASLLDDREARSAMSVSGVRAIDGRGAGRIVRALLATGLRLRAAEAGDCRLTWHWANDQQTREASFESAPIPWETHCAWFRAQTAKIESLLLIAADALGDSIGLVRFERRGNYAITSINLDPRYRRQGFGARVIRKAAREAFGRWPRVVRLEAEIKAANTASQRAFARAGFQPAGEFVRADAPSLLFQMSRENLT